MRLCLGGILIQTWPLLPWSCDHSRPIRVRHGGSASCGDSVIRLAGLTIHLLSIHGGIRVFFFEELGSCRLCGFSSILGVKLGIPYSRWSKHNRMSHSLASTLCTPIVRYFSSFWGDGRAGKENYPWSDGVWTDDEGGSSSGDCQHPVGLKIPRASEQSKDGIKRRSWRINKKTWRNQWQNSGSSWQPETIQSRVGPVGSRS